MGLFTELPPEDAAAIARRYGLGDVRALAPIPAGTINSNFALETDRGRYFVRINEGKREDEVAWEAALVRDLAAAGIPAPVPLAPGTAGAPPYLAWRDRWISVFAWCPGRHLAPAEVTPAAAAALGRMLARIHVAGLGVEPARRRPSRYGFAALEARLAQVAAAAAPGGPHPELADVAAVLADERAVLADAATVATRAAATTGIIHADLFRDNVLWDAGADTDTGEITAVLDFEQASAGSLIYDLAVCLNDWCWPAGPAAGLSANLASAMVAGYQDVRALGPRDLMALPIEVRAAAWRFTLTRLTAVYLPAVDNPEKDFREFFARLVAWRAGGLAGVLGSV
jgi:homoserine kinase type II